MLNKITEEEIKERTQKVMETLINVLKERDTNRNKDFTLSLLQAWTVQEIAKIQLAVEKLESEIQKMKWNF